MPAGTNTLHAPLRPPQRLGAGWDEKKAICNKFVQSAPATCAAWPPSRAGDVCFGLADGKVKLGALKSNKAYTLYAHPEGAAVATLAAAPGGRALVSGHADGSLYIFTFPEQPVRPGAGAEPLVARLQQPKARDSVCASSAVTPRARHPPANAQDGGVAGCVKLAQHSCPPSSVSWGDSIVATGGDCKVCGMAPCRMPGRQLLLARRRSRLALGLSRAIWQADD